MPIDYDGARKLLEKALTDAETDLLHGSEASVGEKLRDSCEDFFRSRTQAYREVLLGCTIARIQDKSINIRQPYVDQGPNAFSGRSLDERVINPFLQEQRIPSSEGPYLAVFRRGVQFDTGTRSGLRDKKGYDALLTAIQFLQSTSDDSVLLSFLRYLLYRFVQLREASHIRLNQLHRISLPQYDALFSGLLDTPSGGRLPVLLVVATLTAIKEFFGLDWEITWQGINVADTAAGARGDITVTSGGNALLAAEVTERPVDRSRVVATFNTKIAPYGIEDYLFFVKREAAAPEAVKLAQQYFSQGHEVNFLEIKTWILMSLATMGRRGRAIFNKALLDLLSSPDVSSTLKMAWNEQTSAIAAGA